jgi:SAM-dependent methyltransferase
MERLEDIKDYWTMRVEGFSRSIVEDINSGRANRCLETIKKHIKGHGPLKVLDIGTGPGLFPILLGREGHEVIAVDYTEAMLEMAKKNCMDFNVSASFIRMDAQKLTFPDDSFDLILSRNLIWNLEMPRQAYKEWLRVLKPDGMMIVFDGNYYLHLYDKDYAAIEEGRRKDEDHRNMMGVDGDIIKEIARDLPLSKEHRPQWDVNTLIELGAGSIEVDVNDYSRGEKSGDGAVPLPLSFILAVKKNNQT